MQPETRFGNVPCKGGLSFGPGRLIRSTGFDHVCGLVMQVKVANLERLLRPRVPCELRFYSWSHQGSRGT